jgi:hypothetical protein
MIRPTGVPPSTRTFLGAPPTLFPGARSNDANPGRRNAPRERDGLFDMVKWDDGERFSDEPQLATRSPILILRSACAPTARQSRMGVRASRRMRTAPFSGLPEIGRIEVPTWVRGPHASRRIAAQPGCGRMRTRLGCDAPCISANRYRAGVPRGMTCSGRAPGAGRRSSDRMLSSHKGCC